MVDPITGCTEVNLHYPSLLPTLHAMHSAVYGTRTEVHHSDPDLSDKQTGLLEARHCMRSINRPRRTDTRRSNTLHNTDVVEIGRKLATEENGEPFGIGVTLACLQQAEKLPRRTSRRNTTLLITVRRNSYLKRLNNS